MGQVIHLVDSVNYRIDSVNYYIAPGRSLSPPPNEYVRCAPLGRAILIVSLAFFGQVVLLVPIAFFGRIVLKFFLDQLFQVQIHWNLAKKGIQLQDYIEFGRNPYCLPNLLFQNRDTRKDASALTEVCGASY
ncbi:hypothetical protein C7B79_22670 [Chroococcidiopsis cubana CCALA 043]|nr:hypothetical protein C7B79_22670 [Chroococcidiopsis cubana CCALA 043]